MTYRDPQRLMCLRCSEVALSPVEIAGVARHTCSRCAGMWIADDQLDVLMVKLGFEPDEPLGPLAEWSALRCPVCRRPMVEEHAYGRGPMVPVDVCPDHGAWFDGGELQAVVARLHLELADRDRSHVEPTVGQHIVGQLTAGVSLMVRAIRDAWRGNRPRPSRSRGRTWKRS
jgi:Zn-finger nucleic acid-binding protein